jgi:hypothetical protein
MADAEVAAAEKMLAAAEMDFKRAEAVRRQVEAQAGSDADRVGGCRPAPLACRAR